MSSSFYSACSLPREEWEPLESLFLTAVPELFIWDCKYLCKLLSPAASFEWLTARFAS